jgi:hypothetical protein
MGPQTVSVTVKPVGDQATGGANVCSGTSKLVDISQPDILAPLCCSPATVGKRQYSQMDDVAICVPDPWSTSMAGSTLVLGFHSNFRNHNGIRSAGAWATFAPLQKNTHFEPAS